MNRRSLDTVFYGGSIYGAKGFARSVEALGIQGDRVVAVGRVEELKPLCTQKTQRRDLSSRCVVPGFLDPHTHFSITTFAPRMADCRTPPLGSVDDVMQMMKAKAARTETGKWVMGWGYNETHLQEGRHPSLEEMEKACPDHPAILMHVSFHQCVLNPLAMDLCGIDNYSAPAQGGRIGKDRLGHLTGTLFERPALSAFQLAWSDLLARAPKDRKRLFADNSIRHLRLGIVRLADASVSPLEKALYLDVLGSGQLPISIDLMEVGEGGTCTPPFHLLQEGSGEKSASTVKLFLDGAEQCAMGFSLLDMIRGAGRLVGRMARRKVMFSHVRNLTQSAMGLDRQGRIQAGFFLNDPEEIEKAVEAAHRLGYPVATHALGNRAVSRMLDIYERVQDRMGAPKRPFRIEHALFLTQDLIQRMAKLNVAAVVQPAFIRDYGALLQGQPLPRSMKILPLREMIDAGVLVAGSSDEPCGNEDPLLGMACAVHRKARNGECITPEQAISKEEALMLYTRNAARVMGCEEESGSLEQGKRADLVICSKDPLRYGFHEVNVVETIVKGRTVWKESSL